VEEPLPGPASLQRIFLVAEGQAPYLNNEMWPEHASPARPVQVVADDREQTAEVVKILSALDGVQVVSRRLRIGDYQINEWLFERKTLPDFAESIKDGRLFSQAKRLASASPSTAFILEGKGSDLAQSKMRREALQGALISLSLIFQIPILRSLAPGETARLLLYAAQQLKRDRSDHVSRHGTRPKRRRKLQLYVLQGLPGIGTEKAARLLAKFGSVEGVMRASQHELELVPGVGEKIATSIRWVLEPDSPSAIAGTCAGPEPPRPPTR
jgi:DNA excision repair protein ERCC-4